jgi:hypothetical protein
MSHKKFGPNDVFINRVKMHPEWDFFIYNTEVFINNSQNISGSHSGNYKGVAPGSLSLYEYNLDRTVEYIHPFVAGNANYKTRFRKDLKNMTGEVKTGALLNPNFESTLTSSYRMSASITRQYLTLETYNYEIPSVPVVHNHTASALKNTCLQYRTINSDFSNTLISSSTQSPLDQLFDNDVAMINIPSIFYGSEIKKGSIDLNYYLTGTLIASAKDENQNGKLISTFNLNGNPTGSVIGYALYREGILFFPSASSTITPLGDSSMGIEYDASADFVSSWLHFGRGANDGWSGANKSSASFGINFEGTTYKNTMTMFCHANKGELNYSNNPTFLNLQQSGSIEGFTSSSYSYEDNEIEIKNIASSSFYKGEDDFRKVTYISKVGIYDEDNNLLMTVDLARPYKKEEKDNFTFKIKYDLL